VLLAAGPVKLVKIRLRITGGGEARRLAQRTTCLLADDLTDAGFCDCHDVAFSAFKYVRFPKFSKKLSGNFWARVAAGNRTFEIKSVGSDRLQRVNVPNELPGVF
jgi:hypothetical protein